MRSQLPVSSEALEETPAAVRHTPLRFNIERENDGYEVVRAIRAIDPTCIAVILTAYASMGSAIEVIHHGVDDYIIKPINADTLATLLAEKMGEHSRTRVPRKYPIVN